MIVAQLAALIHRLGIRVLIAPSPLDPHCDHVTTAALADRLLRHLPHLTLLHYPIWSRWQGHGEARHLPGSRRHTYPVDAGLKARAIAAHASQQGRVIRDDPDGFAMPDGFADMFAEGPEIYDERVELTPWPSRAPISTGSMPERTIPGTSVRVAYETARFAATIAALPRPRFSEALEVGCGNGELARRLAARCDAYTGVDAVAKALEAARVAVPTGRFVQAFFPCPLPDGDYDLIVLSEILYFLDEPSLCDLARQLDTRWPGADVLAVTWLGPSGNQIEGDAALACFAAATQRRRTSAPPGDPRHRIDLFAPSGQVRRMKGNLHIPRGWGRSGFLVAIPCRNEARRLPVALAALARDGVARDVIVIANGCTDATAAVARDFAGLSVAVLDTGSLAGGVGEARRLGFQAALNVAPTATILSTTDADCVVMPGWGRTVAQSLDRAEVVCGRIVPDPEEFARLPDIVRRHGTLEDEVAALTAELDGLRAPAPHDPLPRHNQTPGACLAFRTEAYVRAGGFEAIPCHEDRRIVARIEAAGGRVTRPWTLTVTASCRLNGRAPGGMADTIAARASDLVKLRIEIARLAREATRLRSAIAAYEAAPVPLPAAATVSGVPSLV